MNKAYCRSAIAGLNHAVLRCGFREHHFWAQKGALDLSDEVRLLYKNKFSFRHQKSPDSRTNLLRLPFCLPPTSVLWLQYGWAEAGLGKSECNEFSCCSFARHQR